MKLLGLIPARGGSKGIPDKNIKKLGGKELIRYSIELGLQCPEIDNVLVSTNDLIIADIARRAGAQVPFLRPPALATDQSPTIDTVIHALRFFEDQSQQFDAVCLLQPTSPFRILEDLETAIAHFIEMEADSLISVREVPHQFNPHWVFEPQGDTGYLKIATGEKQIITRRQELPKAYHRDGAIYLTKSETILKRNSLFGERIAFHLSTTSPNINLDTLEDWVKAESWLKMNQFNP